MGSLISIYLDDIEKLEHELEKLTDQKLWELAEVEQEDEEEGDTGKDEVPPELYVELAKALRRLKIDTGYMLTADDTFSADSVKLTPPALDFYVGIRKAYSANPDESEEALTMLTGHLTGVFGSEQQLEALKHLQTIGVVTAAHVRQIEQSVKEADGAGSAAPIAVSTKRYLPRVEDIRALLRGDDSGVPKEYVADFVYALYKICEKTCTFVGELDHFRYDEEDLPELHNFQFGVDSTSRINVPVSEDGLPCGVHWTLGDLQKLLSKVDNIDKGGIPEYAEEEMKDFEDWLNSAVKQGKGLFCFTT